MRGTYLSEVKPTLAWSIPTLFLWANISLFHSPLALSLVLLKSFGFCSLFPPLQEALRLSMFFTRSSINCTNSDSDDEIFSSIALLVWVNLFVMPELARLAFQQESQPRALFCQALNPPPWAVALPVPSALADLGGTVLATLFLAWLPS